MSNQPIIIGMDHGNGWVKAKSSHNMIVLPSYLARKDSFGEDLTGLKLDLHEFESASHKGETLLWGNDISKSENVISTYGAQNRYKQKYYLLLNEFILSSLVDDEVAKDVWVITGAPSFQKGTDQEDELKESLLGSHLVKKDGKDIIIKVKKVVVIPQPVGTVMSQYLDQEGDVANDQYEEMSVAVIDVGTGTTDLDHVKGLRRQEDDSESIPLGMMDVYKRIATYINKSNTNANATPQKVEAQFESDSYVISRRSKIDITEIKEKALETLAMDIKNKIIQRWKTWDRFDEIIVTGGGATPLGAKLKELIEDATPIKSSQVANAEGFYRYGQFLKGASE